MESYKLRTTSEITDTSSITKYVVSVYQENKIHYHLTKTEATVTSYKQHY